VLLLKVLFRFLNLFSQWARCTNLQSSAWSVLFSKTRGIQLPGYNVYDFPGTEWVYGLINWGESKRKRLLCLPK